MHYGILKIEMRRKKINVSILLDLEMIAKYIGRSWSNMYVSWLVNLGDTGSSAKDCDFLSEKSKVDKEGTRAEWIVWCKSCYGYIW